MDRIVAYCGLVCSECPAYLATQANDSEALERVAAEWRDEYNGPNITVQSVLCDGCLGDTGHKCSHCGECEIRACGVARGVANCAACTDYPCDKLQGFFGMVPEARANLDALRPSA